MGKLRPPQAPFGAVLWAAIDNHSVGRRFMPYCEESGEKLCRDYHTGPHPPEQALPSPIPPIRSLRRRRSSILEQNIHGLGIGYFPLSSGRTIFLEIPIHSRALCTEVVLGRAQASPLWERNPFRQHWLRGAVVDLGTITRPQIL